MLGWWLPFRSSLGCRPARPDGQPTRCETTAVCDPNTASDVQGVCANRRMSFNERKKEGFRTTCTCTAHQRKLAGSNSNAHSRKPAKKIIPSTDARPELTAEDTVGRAGGSWQRTGWRCERHRLAIVRAANRATLQLMITFASEIVMAVWIVRRCMQDCRCDCMSYSFYLHVHRALAAGQAIKHSQNNASFDRVCLIE